MTTIRAYTDVPIEELGDIPTKIAPIREVNVISFHGNQYCHCEVNGVMVDIYISNLYTREGRYGSVPSIGTLVDTYA